MFCHFTHTYDYSITVMCSKVFVYFVVSVAKSSLTLWTPWSTRLLCPWDFPGNIRTGSHFLLHGIFPTEGSSQSLLHWQVDSSPLIYLGSQEDLIYSYQSLI